MAINIQMNLYEIERDLFILHVRTKTKYNTVGICL